MTAKPIVILIRVRNMIFIVGVTNEILYHSEKVADVKCMKWLPVIRKM
jgi:flagellar biogenesis protein FliO